MSNSDRSAPAGRTTVATDGANAPTVCAHCGAPIDTSEWHPICTRDDDEEFHVYAFCDEECRRAWAESAE